ncbi:MAG: hypothetical protein LBD23_17830 [Oscillospiraceae bacterium]|nr:hypothetical protein [Oscillospiraceae bacterium]
MSVANTDVMDSATVRRMTKEIFFSSLFCRPCPEAVQNRTVGGRRDITLDKNAAPTLAQIIGQWKRAVTSF